MRRTSVLAALLVASVLPGSASSAAACSRAAADRAGRWWVVEPPRPDGGLGRQVVHGSGASLVAAAVDPADPRVVLAATPSNVQRSDDGGCTWRQVWALGPEDTATGITSIDVARVGGRSRVLLTVVNDEPRPVAGAVRVQVVRSDDGRTGWAPVHQSFGVMAGSQELYMVAVRSGAGGAAYVTVPTPAGTFGYARTTDGTAWESRTAAPGADGLTEVAGVAVSPWHPDEVWEWGRTATGPALRRSTDGARTWQPVDPWPMRDPDPDWRVADVAWPKRGGPARVVVPGGSPSPTTDTTAALAWSSDGGETWGLAFPPKRLSMKDGPLTHTPRGDVVVVMSGGTVFLAPHLGRMARPHEWRKLAPLPNHADLTTFAGYDLARASATTPTVLVVRTMTSLRLLTVRP